MAVVAERRTKLVIGKPSIEAQKGLACQFVDGPFLGSLQDTDAKHAGKALHRPLQLQGQWLDRQHGVFGQPPTTNATSPGFLGHDTFAKLRPPGAGGVGAARLGCSRDRVDRPQSACRPFEHPQRAVVTIQWP